MDGKLFALAHIENQAETFREVGIMLTVADILLPPTNRQKSEKQLQGIISHYYPVSPLNVAYIKN